MSATLISEWMAAYSSEEYKRNVRWYEDHRDELVAKYRHQFVGVCDEKFFGAWNDPLDGDRTMRDAGYKVGRYLLRWCVPKSEAFDYTEWRQKHNQDETIESIYEKILAYRNGVVPSER